MTGIFAGVFFSPRKGERYGLSVSVRILSGGQCAAQATAFFALRKVTTPPKEKYPPSAAKESITGRNEPYHFRYVGVEAATYIMEHNLCLEQFKALYQ